MHPDSFATNAASPATFGLCPISSSESFRVAIIGGGLCGLSFAIALSKRSIPYKIYESRSSFTEIGAGINLGPNALQTFRLIEEALGEAISRLCTRNPPGKEDVWFQLRFGAPTDKYRDAELITELVAGPTGSMTAHRNDLLQLLANKAGLEHAAFNKKVVGLNQSGSGVTLRFADGTEEAASAVIACDGVHSVVRRAILGQDHQSASPQYTGGGAYRAIIPTQTLKQVIGAEMSCTSQMLLGPDAYVITYPIENGQTVNIGLWSWRRGPWAHREWVLPAQKKEMEKQFAALGETVHKIMDLMDDPPYFATHHHSIQPESFFQGRVCLIGDAAHSMPPHQGAGASQAVEDAFVMAEVLQGVDLQRPTQAQIEAAFKGYEAIRKPRSQRVLQTSVEAFNFWTGFYSKGLTDDDVHQFIRNANERFQWIWHDDIASQAKRARDKMQEHKRRHSSRMSDTDTPTVRATSAA